MADIINQYDNGNITICGYDMFELVLFAKACRKQGITESELHDFCLSFKTTVIRMLQPTEDLKETLNRIYGHTIKWED